MTAPSSASTPAKEFFATIENTFERAARRTGITTRSLALAGAHVRLRFAGESLVLPMTRSLAHLATSDVLPPDLTILLWDTAASGVPVPPPPWERDAYGRRGEIVGFSDAAIFSAYQHNAGSLLLYDARRRLALYAAVDGSALPTYETSVPLRSIFHWWAQSRGGLQMTHAAAVGRGDGCVLVIGESGAGKSSTALACLDSPLSFLSDDYCLVGTEGAPVVHCLYGTAKATAAGLAALPASLSAMVGNPHEAGREKLVLCLSEHVPHKLLPAPRCAPSSCRS